MFCVTAMSILYNLRLELVHLQIKKELKAKKKQQIDLFSYGVLYFSSALLESTRHW